MSVIVAVDYGLFSLYQRIYDHLNPAERTAWMITDRNSVSIDTSSIPARRASDQAFVYVRDGRVTLVIDATDTDDETFKRLCRMARNASSPV